jgi:uncharacterized Fe-S center protein
MQPSKADKKRTGSLSKLFFANAAVEVLETQKTLPVKFRRMLVKCGLADKVKGKRVAIKIHFGQDIGFTTIHPLFVRILVQAVKDSGARSVIVTDSRPLSDGLPRGYTSEVLGCPVVSAFGDDGKHFYREPIGYKSLDEALLSGVILDCDVFIGFAHVKGHGACGFGGALKNIAMGNIPVETRSKLHKLEGGLTYDRSKCTLCLKCYDSCPNSAIEYKKEKKEISFFYHHCTFCQHCIMVCPSEAIKMEDRQFDDFSRGMARVTEAFLTRLKPENLLFINYLLNVTMYCDCWGFSSPSLVPDIGILAGDDIAAIDTASLDMIKTENLLSNGLPKNRTKLTKGTHLFEKIHGKNPYLMIRYLTDYYNCTTEYEVEEVL